jgi:hypothetical protein
VPEEDEAGVPCYAGTALRASPTMSPADVEHCERACAWLRRQWQLVAHSERI